MIGESLIDLFFGVFRVLFSAFEIVNLPTQVISTLETVMSYGVWVVGADIMIIFAGSVITWWTVHLSVGMAIWLWDKLPLT